MPNSKLITALLAVMAKAEAGALPEPDFGICMNLTVELIGSYRGDEGYEAVAKLTHKFGLCSGYPVPNPNHQDYWQGRQLELRLDLMSKMVTYLEIQDVQENCSSQAV